MRTLFLCALVALVAPLSHAQITLPITFEEEINYELTDFGGNASQLVADPEDPTNTVVQSTKMAEAELWAGTTVAEVSGFSAPLPFAPGATTMSVRVWSPVAGIPIRLKVEKVGDPTVSVETEATVAVAGAWDTLVFDFANQAPGTAPLNFGSTYNKASIFFNFGTPGNVTGARTYFWDDVAFGEEGPPPTSPISLPITFEEEINYELTDFGGNASQLVADPTDPTNTVVRTARTAGAECWAGTSVAAVSGLSAPIPFAPGQTTMSVRVWSPAAGVRVLFKVEQVGVPTVNVETYTTTTVGGAWETLVFDFANPRPNQNPIAFGANYNMASIFFDFRCGFPEGEAPERTYYWDDVAFGTSVSAEDDASGAHGITLAQNYPNPVRTSTAISFTLPRAEHVAVHVYNALGQRVATLVDAPMESGVHVVTFDTASLASGKYFYRLHHGQGHVTRSMVLTR